MSRGKTTRLKIAILASGLTPDEIAAKIHRSPESVYRWANHSRHVPVGVKIAFSRVLSDTPAVEYLDTTVDGLFRDDPGHTGFDLSPDEADRLGDALRVVDEFRTGRAA